MIEVNMEAEGVCIGNIRVEFWNFPLCSGRSCNAQRFVDSYREKLHTETDFVSGDCRLDLVLVSDSGGANFHNRVVWTVTNAFVLAVTVALLIKW